ncbi:MAG: DNA polymerase IV [Desulfuromonadales bacterium]
MNRDILHLVVPAFPIALARVADSSLRERPVAVVPGHSDRALLQHVSPEARADGVFAGMSAYRARRLCPSLILIPPDPELLAKGSTGLLEISRSYSPLTETNAQGRLFLDVSGCRRLLGPSRDIAAKLDREIANRLRLQGSVGVAGNKLVSRIASDYLDKPGVCDVLRGAERNFIGPLSVSVLPGIGQARQAVLMQDLNLQRVEEVAALAIAQLRIAFGPFAPLLHQRACGVDPSPVQPPKRTPEVSEESFLSEEENDDQVLLAELCRLVEASGRRLRSLKKDAGALTLTVNYADGVSHKRTSTLTVPNNQDHLLFETAEDLFHKACQRRVRVKGLNLVCSKFTTEKIQMDLFAGHAEGKTDYAALQYALDRVRDKYGMQSLQWGRTLR